MPPPDQSPTAAADRSSDDRGAPPAEDDRKPDSPAEMSKRSWLYVLKKTAKEFSDDQCTDLAAALTYYAVLAIAPAIVALVSLLGVFGQGPSTVESLLGVLEDVGAGAAVEPLSGPLEAAASSPGAGLALIVGLLGALWSASGYVGAFSRAMNRVYEIREGRPFWKLRPTMLVVTLVALLLIVAVAMMLVLTGPVAQSVGDLIGLGGTAVTAWNIAKWPVMAVFVVLIVAILYYATPNVKQPKFRWISLGAVIAIVTWVVASALFGFYVANFSSYDATYGALAGVVVFLLWLWITNLALLFGAEFDAEMERGRQLEAGIAAEADLQLPARDTRTSDKKAAKEAIDVREGRDIRVAAAAQDDSDRDTTHGTATDNDTRSTR